MRINPEGPNVYPYTAIADDTERLINISEERIEVIDRHASVFFEEDYLPTSRFIEFDLDQLDQMVHQYIGPFEYDILVYFNEEKHTVLTYHSPTNEAPKSYDIFDGYPEPRARKLVTELQPVFVALREAAEIADRG